MEFKIKYYKDLVSFHIPDLWLLSKTGNVNMVWWSFVIAELVSVTLSFVFFARLDKKIIEPMYDNAAAAQ